MPEYACYGAQWDSGRADNNHPCQATETMVAMEEDCGNKGGRENKFASLRQTNQL